MLPALIVSAALLAQEAAFAAGSELPAVTAQVDADLRAHRSDDAIQLLRKTLESNPQWRYGWWLLGSVLYDTDKYIEARPILEHLVQLDSKSGSAWMLLGLCEFEMKDYGPALQHLQRGDALGIPPELNLLDVVRYHEALLLMFDKRFDPAQVLLDHLARKGLDTDEIVITQGLIALRIAEFPDALNTDRLTIVRSVGRAQRALALEKSAEAVAIYRELMKDAPKTDNLHLSFASALMQDGDRREAESELRAELRQNPQSVEARLRLCLLLEDATPSDAIALAEQAAALDPKSAKAHFALGRASFKAGKLEASAKELEISRSLDPTSSAVRYALMRTYRGLGRTADAKREAAAFERLKAAESQFHSSGQVPASLFEPDK